MFPHNFNNQFLFNFNGALINTENIYIASEMLADLYIAHRIENGQIVFPTAPTKPVIVAAVATENEIAPEPKPLQPVTVSKPAIKAQKQPIFAFIGAPCNNRTCAELKRFLAQNTAILSESNTSFHASVLTALKIEILKPLAQRCDIIDIVESCEVSQGLAKAEPKITVLLKTRPVANGMSSLVLEFSEIITHPDSGARISRITLENKIFTKAVLKSEKTWNADRMLFAEGSREKWEKMVNK